MEGNWGDLVKVWLKRIALVALLSQPLSVLVSAPTQAAVEITIAYQGPLSGPESHVGIPQLNGAKYAISKFNAASTKYKVQLTTIDDQGDPSIAQKISPAVADNKNVIGLVGPAYSGPSRVSLPLYIKAGLVTISPSAQSITFTDPSSTFYAAPVFHRVVGINFSSALAKHSVKGVSAPKAFIIDGTENFFGNQIGIIRDTLTSLKASVVGSQEVTSGTTDFSPVIASIKSTGANVVIYDGYDNGAAALVKQLRDSGFAGIFSAGNVTFGKDFLAIAGKSAEGARITTSAVDSISQISTTLEADFKKTTGASSGTYSIEAIDATNIMLSCIDKGNITRETLLKCVKEYRGKSLLGAEISFDSYGDISGNHTYVGEVKNSQIQFADPITNVPIVRKVVESTEAEINLKSVSARTISPGENVSWNFEVTVQPGWTKGIYLQIADAQGQIRYLNLDLTSQFKGGLVEKAETFTTDLVLQTHTGLLPGKYSLANFCIEGQKRDCVTDPKYASTFNQSRQNRSVNLEEFSFQVKDTGTNLREAPLKISKITAKKRSYSPGEVMQFEVEATGKMTMRYTYMSLMVGTNGVTAICQPPSYYSNCNYVQDKEKGVIKIFFTFPIPDDYPASKVEITNVYLSSIGASTASLDSQVNSTAGWHTAYIYYDKSVRAEFGEILATDQTFDFTVYSATILDAGGVEKRQPTWSNLAWENSKVSAGSEAMLTLDINGYHRFLSSIYLYSLVSTSGNTIQLKDIVTSSVSTDPTEGIYPLRKSGRYQIKVTIPRSAPPGTYRLGQLTVQASNCQAKNAMEWSQKVNNGTGQCFGLNFWETTYNTGYLSSLSWPGSEKNATLTLEILPAAKPVLPQFKVVSTDANSIKIDYPFDYELTCDFSADKGSLTHQQVSKGQSNNGLNNLIINDLKPDSVLKLTGACTGSDGMKGDSAVVEFKAAKPFPPAVPKVTANEIGVETAKFDFVYRDGFKYQVKTNSGEVFVGNGTIEFKRLAPESKVEFQLSITDPYAQTTTSDPIAFTTNRPKPPATPALQLVNKGQTRVSVSTKFESQYEYEITSTSGTASIIGSQINISGLKPGEQFTLLVTAKDKFQQSVTAKENFQTELPSPPRIPSLISKAILSNEITVTVTQQEGAQLVIKSSAGVVSVSDNTVKVSSLLPRSIVTLSAYSVDQFGQSSPVVTKNYTTRAPAPQRSLTCTNGKTTRIVVGANPVCPAGFKRK
jgi:branched-chain amino acid transport system substrate-binding protein